jgi:hypothetical protein
MPRVDAAVSMAVQAMTVLLFACAVSVILFGQAMRPVLQWETRMLDKLTEGGE